MEGRLLRAEWWPQGVLVRLSEVDGVFYARWRYQQLEYRVEGPVLLDVLKDALVAIETLESQEGVL